MKSYLECYPCFLKQAVEAAKIATNDDDIHWQILSEVMKIIKTFPKDEVPPMMGKIIHEIVRRYSQNKDPYLHVKKEYNEKATDLLPLIKKEIESSADRDMSFLKLLAIGNIIDFGPFGINQVDFEEFVHSKMENSTFKGNASPESFIASVKKAKKILYIADNCGEIIFDSYFINNYLKGKRVFLSVRGGPVLNDVTMSDLEGITYLDHVTVISNGDDAPGVILKNSSPEFIDIYKQADLVILKGQGNFEGIGHPDREGVYSILVAKCPVLARHIGCEVNDLVLTNP